jgi:hypothetical protein
MGVLRSLEKVRKTGGFVLAMKRRGVHESRAVI